MYLSDLCSAKNAQFTGFVGFPQFYPPETKTPAHLLSQYNLIFLLMLPIMFYQIFDQSIRKPPASNSLSIRLSQSFSLKEIDSSMYNKNLLV